MQRLNHKTTDERLGAMLRRLADQYPPRPLPATYVIPARACFLLASAFERLALGSLSDQCDAAGFSLLVMAARRS
jgi:hypothetical protein